MTPLANRIPPSTPGRTPCNLNPSPEQRIRIRLTLGEKLAGQGDDDEAVANYHELLAEAPDYPGKTALRKN